jgi:hypothetical protein
MDIIDSIKKTQTINISLPDTLKAISPLSFPSPYKVNLNVSQSELLTCVKGRAEGDAIFKAQYQKVQTPKGFELKRKFVAIFDIMEFDPLMADPSSKSLEFRSTGTKRLTSTIIFKRPKSPRTYKRPYVFGVFEGSTLVAKKKGHIKATALPCIQLLSTPMFQACSLDCSNCIYCQNCPNPCAPVTQNCELRVNNLVNNGEPLPGRIDLRFMYSNVFSLPQTTVVVPPQRFVEISVPVTFSPPGQGLFADTLICELYYEGSLHNILRFPIRGRGISCECQPQQGVLVQQDRPACHIPQEQPHKIKVEPIKPTTFKSISINEFSNLLNKIPETTIITVPVSSKVFNPSPNLHQKGYNILRVYVKEPAVAETTTEPKKTAWAIIGPYAGTIFIIGLPHIINMIKDKKRPSHTIKQPPLVKIPQKPPDDVPVFTREQDNPFFITPSRDREFYLDLKDGRVPLEPIGTIKTEEGELNLTPVDPPPAIFTQGRPTNICDDIGNTYAGFYTWDIEGEGPGMVKKGTEYKVKINFYGKGIVFTVNLDGGKFTGEYRIVKGDAEVEVNKGATSCKVIPKTDMTSIKFSAIATTTGINTFYLPEGSPSVPTYISD